MDEKENTLDNLFVAENDNEVKDTSRNKDTARNVENEYVSLKDNDAKSINNAVNELSKEFEKKNKEELNRLKREESIKSDVENFKENEGKIRKSKVAFLLSLLSFPFVLLGGLLVWNYFLSDKNIYPLAIITVLMCVSAFAIGVKSFIVGVQKKGKFKYRLKPLALGILFVAFSVLIIIFRTYLERYAFLIAGCLSFLIAFIALLSSALKRDKSKNNIAKIIFSGLALIGSVLLILAGIWLTEVAIYLQITGIYLVLVGCSLFIY